MGEIWKAQDARLNRMVAIKVLTNASTGDSDRRRRFILEAQAASGLNHPNIITIYDILSDADSEYMVMELVTGKTLADLIVPGGIGVEKTLRYSAQIADALRAAHAAGIVHRDLKPGNVMVTDSGLVKILDFGLAKMNVATELTEETQTIGAPSLTVEGSILGTVAYMSPEQAQGKKVDARSDIFSFGVVMYEMLTGAKAFSGDSAITTLTAILRDEVKPVEELVAAVPPELVEIIALALRKDPKDRWQSTQVMYTVLAAQKQKLDSGAFSNPSVSVSAVRPASQPPSLRPGSLPAGPGGLPPGPASVPPVSGREARREERARDRSGLGGQVKRAPKWVWIAVGLSFAYYGMCGRSKTVKISRDKGTEIHVPGVDVTIPATPAPVPPPTPETGDAATVLTNQSIMDMAEASVPDGVIISHIRASKTKFNLSTEEIIKLAKYKVSATVIEAMRNPTAPVRAAGSGAVSKAAAPVPAPPVALPKAMAPVPVAASTPETVVPVPVPVAPPKPVAAETHAVAVGSGVPFLIALTEDVPLDPAPGRALHFQSASEVVVNGTVVIAKGAAVTGEVLGLVKKNINVILRRPGKPVFKLTDAVAVDGSKVKVRATAGKTTDKNEHNLEPQGKKVKELLAPAGSSYTAYFDGDQTVNVKK